MATGCVWLQKDPARSERSLPAAAGPQTRRLRSNKTGDQGVLSIPTTKPKSLVLVDGQSTGLHWDRTFGHLAWIRGNEVLVVASSVSGW